LSIFICFTIYYHSWFYILTLTLTLALNLNLNNINEWENALKTHKTKTLRNRLKKKKKKKFLMANFDRVVNDVIGRRFEKVKNGHIYEN
jgi:hypothetical protein